MLCCFCGHCDAANVICVLEVFRFVWCSACCFAVWVVSCLFGFG